MLNRVFRIVGQKYTRKITASFLFRIFLVVLDLVGIALIGFAVSVATGKIANSGLVNLVPISPTAIVSSVNSYAFFAALGVGFFVLKALLSLALNRWTANMIADIETSVSSKAFQNLLKAPFREIAGWSDQKIIYALHYSTEMAFGRRIYSTSILLGEIVLIVLVCAYLAAINFVLFILLVIFFSSLVGVLYFTSSKKSSNISRLFDKLQVRSNTMTQDALNVQAQLRFSKNFNRYADKFSETRKGLAIANGRIAELSVFPRYILELAMLLAVLLVAAHRLTFRDANIPLEDLGVFLAGSFRILASLLPLQGSINMLKQISETGQSSLDLIEGLNETTEGSSGEIGITEPRAVFRNISILANGSNRFLVRDFSDEVIFGTTVGIVGPSGSGKTSLMETLLGFRSPSSGSVGIGDSILVSPRQASGLMAYCPQNIDLIHGSLFENLTFSPNQMDVDWTRLERAIDDSGLREVVNRLEKGLNTEIGTDANSFSGGEIQRIGICRAIYQEPKILVLDEPSSALDSLSAQLIYQSILRLSERMTIFVITHNPETLLYCGKVYNFEVDGQVQIVSNR